MNTSTMNRTAWRKKSLQARKRLVKAGWHADNARAAAREYRPGPLVLRSHSDSKQRVAVGGFVASLLALADWHNDHALSRYCDAEVAGLSNVAHEIARAEGLHARAVHLRDRSVWG